MNPDLLPPGTDPSRPSAVPPLNALTAPFGTTKVKVAKEYVCTVPNASLHRKDGKRLGFVFGYLSTNILEDQQYLDGEIDAGNPYVREATPEESHDARMKLDPRGTMRQTVTAEIEADLRVKLEAEIRAQYENKGLVPTGSPAASNADGAKLAGTDTVQSVLNKLKQKNGKDPAVIKTEGATVVMTSQPAPLSGIVGSDKVAAGAADSVGGAGL